MELVDLLSFAVVGALLAGIGKGINSMVYGSAGPKPGHKGWRGVWYVTLWLHPIVVGGLLGLSPWLPAPEAMGSTTAGRVLWYAAAGLFASTLYDAIRGFIKQRFAIRESIPPTANKELGVKSDGTVVVESENAG